MTITVQDVLSTIHDPDAHQLLAAAVYEVTERERRTQERAARLAEEQAAAYRTVRAQCAGLLPPNLRPYVRTEGGLITGGFHIPPRHWDRAELELKLPGIELPMRTRFNFEPVGNGNRTSDGAWRLAGYVLPGVYRTHKPTGDEATYGWDEHLTATATEQQDALAYLVHLLAEYRTIQQELQP